MKIIECPRDAMQGLHTFIPTERKVEYINALLKVGFDTIDFGSFVSHKVIPQMQDTWKVVSQLDMSETDSKLLAIVANERGAKDASEYEQITYLGFPFSISEKFQLRNTNATQEQAFNKAQDMLELCLQKDKTLVVYLSMGFGNPYGEMWHPALVEHWADRFAAMGVEIISVADTVGLADSEVIGNVFKVLTYDFPEVEFGAHFHTEAHLWKDKMEAAYRNGCGRFDSAIKGLGGCPMAQNKLVGNMPTENVIDFFADERADFFIDEEAFEAAKGMAVRMFMEEFVE
ncbi:MAG: hydroxymethylglutaryl-CoA lyase [Chitinophagales bacterium]